MVTESETAALIVREGRGEGATLPRAVQRSLGHKSAVMTLDRYSHLWPDELEDLAERLDRARPRQSRPPCALSADRPSSRYAKEQVSDLLPWWRWGDSNSRPAASFQGFSERSRRLRFGPGLSGGDAPGS
jgi:hypothetical protein